MKNPSVPSRCGSNWTRSSSPKSRCSSRKASTTFSPSAREIVQTEYTSDPPGASALRARGEDPGLERRELADRLRARPPAQVRPRLERAEPAAWRVDQNSVERAVGPRNRCVLDLHAHARGAHPRHRPLERRGPARVALNRDDLAGDPPSAPPDAWSCRRGPRTDRVPAPPARGPSMRDTSIDARDCGWTAPARHSSEPWTSNGPVEHEPLGQARRPGGSAPAARPPPPSTVATSGIDPQRGLGRLVDHPQ